MSPVPITDERAIYVLMRGDEFPTARELAEFIEDGEYFETEPSFVPDPDSLGEELLESLEVVWDEDRPPVILRRCNPDELEDQVSAARAVLEKMPEQRNDRIAAALRTLPLSKAMVQILVDGETMSEESWGMVDTVEAFLARRYAGLVYVPGDGLFDADLQPIYRRAPK